MIIQTIPGKAFFRVTLDPYQKVKKIIGRSLSSIYLTHGSPFLFMLLVLLWFCLSLFCAVSLNMMFSFVRLSFSSILVCSSC